MLFTPRGFWMKFKDLSANGVYFNLSLLIIIDNCTETKMSSIIISM